MEKLREIPGKTEEESREIKNIINTK